MEFQLFCIGKTNRKYLSIAINEYQKRLQHFIKFSIVYLPETKIKINQKKLKHEESKIILKNIKNDDLIILLDEKGIPLTSVGFSKKLNKLIISGKKRIIFVIGGAYGFSDCLYKKFPEVLALSPMTFSHQIVRLIFCEQLYRAFTIINNHPYHN